jgi:hypothetical protein
MSSFTKTKNLNVNDITYGVPKVSDRGNKSIALLYKGTPLTLQFPLMLTWGLNERVDDKTGNVSYDLALQFQPNKSKSVETFLEKLKLLQNKLYNDTVANSKDWFGKTKLSREVTEAQCWPILKYPKLENSDECDYTRMPTVKIKAPFWAGKFNFELFDSDGKALFLPPKDGQDLSTTPQGDKSPMEFIPKGTHMTGIIRCGGIWYAGGRWGVTWRLQQAKCRKPIHLVGSGTCQMEDDSDDDEFELELNRKDKEHSTTATNIPPPYKGCDMDDDEDEEEDELKVPSTVQKEDEEEDEDEDEEEKEEDEDEDEEEEEEEEVEQIVAEPVAPVVVEEKPKKIRKRVVRKKPAKA